MKKFGISWKAIAAGMGFSSVSGVCAGYLLSVVATFIAMFQWAKNGKQGTFDPALLSKNWYQLSLVILSAITDTVAGIVTGSLAKQRIILHGAVAGVGILALSFLWGMLVGIDEKVPPEFVWYLRLSRVMAFLAPILGALLVYRSHSNQSAEALKSLR